MEKSKKVDTKSAFRPKINKCVKLGLTCITRNNPYDPMN